ncbi:MAG: rRNA maturation RNAse YbeY [Gammaproteobacteria bacterium]
MHGILHLRGYDHENDDEAGEMEQMEITLLDKIGYPNPYETELES